MDATSILGVSLVVGFSSYWLGRWHAAEHAPLWAAVVLVANIVVTVAVALLGTP